MRKLKTTAVAVLAGILCAACAGCGTEIKPDSPDAGVYSTQTPSSAIDYNMYMAREITVFVNQLTSHIIMWSNSGTGMYENEITLAEESLEIMQESYDEVVVTMPAKTADDDREGLLTAMQTAIRHMENYIEALREDGDVSEYVTDFKNDNTALTMFANLYYQ